MSLDTQETRATWIAAEHAEVECCPLWAAEVADVDVTRAWSVAVDDLVFVRAETVRGTECFVVDGAEIEQVSPPCRECRETGRRLVDSGPFTRWEPCWCRVGYGDAGRWV